MKRVASAVAVAVGRGVERALTGRAALGYYRTLLASTTEPEARAQAIFAGVRVAIGLDDRAAIAELVAGWATIPPGFRGDEVNALCKQLARAGLAAEAVALAGAEVERHRTAAALYLWARCSDALEDAPRRYLLAVERAEREGARHIVEAARRRRALLLARRWETHAEALAEASALDRATMAPRDALAVARVLLGSPSRFVRATALGVLDELVTTERRETRLAAQALRAAARFVDDMGAGVTPLEIERLSALFGRPYALATAPRAQETVRAIEALLRAPASATSTGPRSRRARLGAAYVALLGDDVAARDAAIALVAEHLRVPSAVAPPRGWAATAQALAVAGAAEVAALARTAAAASREPGAVEALGLTFARDGWALAERDPAAALAKLREAKRVQQR